MPNPHPPCPRCGADTPTTSIHGLLGICAGCLAHSVAEAERPFAEAWLTGPQTPLPRRLGDYELQQEIARGGMGVVYLARQLSLGRQVAVKLLLPGFVASPARLARFRSEATLAARLQHPNIVSIHEICEHDGVPFFAMEYVEGRDLGRLVREQLPTSRHTAQLVRTVARAIHYAHERGVLHRDLKPSNVLVNPEGEPRVTDFGLAKPLNPDCELTLSGEILGSPSFMAPEQAAGRRGEIDVRTDVYGLGSLLYHALTGRPPFLADTVSGTLQRVIEGDPVPPGVLQPGVPRDLETITLRCLARDPRHRYASAAEVADELDRFLHGHPIRARSPRVAERMWRWARREPTLAGWLATAVILGAALVGGSFAFASQRELAHQGDVQRRSVVEMHRYVADVSLASRALGDGNTHGALQLLDGLTPPPGEPDRRGFEWHWLHSRTTDSTQNIWWKGGEPIGALAWSPDGRRLALLHARGVRIIAAGGNRLFAEHRLSGPSLRRTAAFSHDGGHLFIGDRTGLRRLELTVGRADVLSSEPVDSLAVSSDGQWLAVKSTIDSGEHDKSDVLVLDAGTGDLRQRLEGVGGPGLLWTPAGRLVGVAGDGRIWSWESTGGLRQRGRVRGPSLIAAALSKDAGQCATLDTEGTLRWVEIESGRVMAERHETPYREARLELSPEGHGLVLVGGADQRVTVLAVPGLTVEHRWAAHSDLVTAATFRQDGRWLVTAANDGTVRAWNLEEAPLVHPWSHTCIALPSLASQFSSDARWVAALHRNDTGEETALWSVADPDARPVTVPGRPMGFSPDGKFLLQWESGGMIRLWDITNGTETVSFHLNPKPSEWPDQLSPDGRFFLCLGYEGRLHLYHSATAEELPAPIAHIHRAIVSPDSQWIGYITKGNVGIYEVAPHEQFQVICPEVTELAFSPDSRYLAVGGAAGRVHVYEVATRKQVAELSGHAAQVTALTFSPDGRTLVSAGDDAAVRWWHVPAWRELVHLPQPATARLLRYSPDGRCLLVGLESEYRVLSAGEALPSPSLGIPGGFWQDPVNLGWRLARRGSMTRR